MFAIVRLRGTVNVSPDIRYALALLRLHRVNHCALLEENEYTRGMIAKVKDYVAWGPISEETLVTLLKTRGRLTGGHRLTDEYVRTQTPFGSLPELARALLAGTVTLRALEQYHIKPLLRLHPPRKGLRGKKRSFQQGGDLGYHGEQINALLYKMR
jgi:large subunit ribosomal protein L30